MSRTPYIHAGVAVVLTLVLALAYWFLLSHTRSLASQARSLSAQIASASGTQPSGSTVRDMRTALEADEAFLAERFVPEGGIVDFLETLEAAGEREGAVVQVVSVSDAENGRIEIALSLDGSFSSVMAAAGTIEHGPYASATKSLTLEAVEGGWSAKYLLIVAAP